MAGISYFTPEDFYIGQGQRGPLLCIKDNRLTLVFFFSNRCQSCAQFSEVILNCPGNIVGAQFAMVNVAQRDLAIYKMSLGTIMALDTVPFIVLYFNGKPYMRYSGAPNIREIATFINDLSVRIKSSAPVNKDIGMCKVPADSKARIPAYCVGRPADDDDNFSTYGAAYGK